LRWVAEGRTKPSTTARAYFDAVPKAWGLSACMPYPDPIVDPAEGRRRALAAYQHRGF